MSLFKKKKCYRPYNPYTFLTTVGDLIIICALRNVTNIRFTIMMNFVMIEVITEIIILMITHDKLLKSTESQKCFHKILAPY